MAASMDVNSPIASKLSPVCFQRNRKSPPKSLIRKNVGSETQHKGKSREFGDLADRRFCSTPIIIEFRRLLLSPKYNSINAIPGVSNRDLLHATVALYDNCLPDITPEVLYSTVCDKWATTVLLVRNVEGTQKNKQTTPVNDKTDCESPTEDKGVCGRCEQNRPKTKDLENTCNCDDGLNSLDAKRKDSVEEEDANGTILKEGPNKHNDDKKRTFADVFSAQRVILPPAVMKRMSMISLKEPSCFSSWCPGENTIQIDLLAVRRRYRKSGVGKYLIQKLKDPSMVGRFDNLVVYADHSAVDFFSGYGFSDDIVLNSKYSELADNWTNCTLMCYIPPFTGQTMFRSSDESLDLKAMELELQKWTQKSREAYQAQFSCLMRFRHEIIALRALVSSQQDIITSLSNKVDVLHAEKQDLDRKNLLQRVFALKAGIDLDGLEETPDTGYHEWDDCEGGEEGANLDSSSIIQDLERRVRDMGTESDIEGDEGTIDWAVAEEFAFAMREDSLLGDNFSVTRTKKAQPTPHTLSLYSSWCDKLNDPSMKTKMYFCGSLLHPERIHTILENGFSSLDFSCGDYGMGLYFSQHPSTAAHFSALGKIILAEVAIGIPETMRQADRMRAAASRGYDSVITQGRLPVNEETSSSVRTRQQEYVIFHPSQALPLYLLEYQTSS
ncbi:hypothetical protein BSL78_28544 [Apostichopus japonicus]|uniref:PARP catalytic domain-containing protein n=1 Tax=Stichopus japonicus TaxID=307972 RepID=A0A2G8JFX5_STIJA|nr:hypothetical protein BSL78_28544 [Apostichopus japonicus]